MDNILKAAIIGLFFGTFGTTIGGIIGIRIKKHSNKFLSFILALASGLMMSVICFDLIPTALETTDITKVISGIIIGIVIMIFCDIFLEKKVKKLSSNSLVKTGIIVAIGLTIHNIPEGLAIGSGFESSMKLGLSLAVVICLHDLPEGIAIAIPMKKGGMKKNKILKYVILSGVTTAIGTIIGVIIGGISETVIALCLSLAAGSMLYIVSGELLPESCKLYSGRLSSIGNVLGFILGMIVTLKLI